jgi:hypothetical protein
MREVLRRKRRAAVVLIALACGCGSTIENSGEIPDDLGGAAGDSMTPLSSSGSGGARAGSGGGAAPSNGGRQAPAQAGRGGTGTGGTMGQPTAGTSAAGSGGGGPVNPGDCFDATMLWFEDFETGDYSRWTSNGYGDEWGDDCQNNGLSTETSVSGETSQRSEIVCPYTADDVHRGYGGLQFSGDEVESSFTNSGTGTDAPDGIVNTMWLRIDSPTVFENGTWIDLWTVNAACDWSDAVLTLGIEDPSDRLAAAHYQNGGSRTFEPNAPGIPRGQWFRVTIYFNYHTGQMHVWQDGESISHVTFSRPIRTVCHWHWGLYASADNDDVVMFEDDKSIWKLNEPWDDFSVEPYFGEEIATCN